MVAGSKPSIVLLKIADINTTVNRTISNTLGVLFIMDYKYYKKNNMLRPVKPHLKLRNSLIRRLLGSDKVMEKVNKKMY